MAKTNIYLLTFNCARTLVDVEAFARHLLGRDPKPTPDLLVLSLQEVAPIAYAFLGGTFLLPYFSRLAQAVDRASAGALRHVATHNAGMTAVMLFGTPAAAAAGIEWLQRAAVGVGDWGLGNKGAVGFRVGFADDRSLTFVAAHLAPFEDAWERRNRDWESIVRGLAFTNVSAWDRNDPAQSAGAAPSQRADVLFMPGSPVFLAGDLNYRTSDVGPAPDAHLAYPQPTSPPEQSTMDVFKDRDQLSRERSAQRTLHELDELPVSFPPTYKYSPKHQGLWPSDGEEPEFWHWAKHRFPSWCDRILFSSYLTAVEGVFEGFSYQALPLQTTSDHRPVALSLEVDLERASDSRAAREVTTPFPLDPLWEQRRASARRGEIAVGIVAYLGLTWEGNGLLLASFAGAVGAWFMYKSMTA